MKVRRTQERRQGAAGLQIFAAVLCLAIIGVFGFRMFTQADAQKVQYPYWCAKCQAVFDVSELKEDYPKNWRIPPGAPSDSVVLCLKCDEGWAYPAAKCYDCGTEYLLHRMPRTDCPTCHPEVAKRAAARGVSLTPPELSR